MKTILVEESLKAAGTFEAMVQQIPEVHMIGIFQNDWSVLHFMEHNAVDLVVVEADAKKADGMFLAKYLRKQYPNVMVIVISDTADYAMEAFQIHAAAYLLKPYTKEEFAYAVDSACLLSKRKKKGVFVKTFGCICQQYAYYVSKRKGEGAFGTVSGQAGRHGQYRPDYLCVVGGTS